ncbi:MAG: class II glutamine amidotransferase [Infirmifilum sp.]
MCRLFAFIARRPISPSFAFFTGDTNLSSLSQEHKDGWGVAWTSNTGWELHKEPIPLYTSENARKLIPEIRTMLLIAHIRKASQGEVSYKNTHPFLYDTWAFAHNGTINSYESLLELLGEKASRLAGNTDSEAFFHLLLSNIEALGDTVEGVKKTISQLEGIGYTSLNSVFSDGSQLYALNLFKSQDTEYYTMYMGWFMIGGVELVAVASEPLGDIEGWVPIGNGKLLVIDRKLTPTVYPLPPHR